MAIPARFGEVTRLNTNTSGGQDQSSVAVLRNGSIVVTWTDGGSTLGDIRYRQFDARLGPATADRTANAVTAGVQEDPEVAALAGGGFALVWTNSLVTNGNIAAQAFNAVGTATGGQVDVSSAAGNQRQGAIAGTANGGFVVAWEDDNAAVTGVTSSAVMARGYTALGVAFGTAPIRISGDTGGFGGDGGPALAANGTGFVGAWQDGLPPDSAIDGIYGRGFAGSVLPVAAAGQPDQLDGGPLNAFMSDPDVALLAGGLQVTVWERNIQGNAAASEIMLRRGSAISTVNTTSASDQVNPAVAALAGGGFVVVWQDFSAGNANADIRARVYDAAGAPTSDDFLVPDTANAVGQQFNPDVAGLIDGRFIVTWSTLTFSNGSNLDIAAQIFDPRTAAQTWFGGTAGERYVGTAFDDSLNGGFGNDWIEGEGGADTLIGSIGSDTLDGGAGIDRLLGGGGNDVYFVEAQSDVVFEAVNQGIDTIRVSAGAAYVIVSPHVEVLILDGGVVTGTGNALANTITGNGSANVLRGLGGADTMLGGAGADVLIGGADADSLAGGAGPDQYRLLAATESASGARDTIVFQYSAATGFDRIDLRFIDANPFLAGDNAFGFIGAAAFPGGGAAGAGRLRAAAAGPGEYLVQADIDGDGAAEIELLVQSATAPVAGWFLL